jgi:[ribosomal protein S5]-alanine N-acetyltransferase
LPDLVQQPVITTERLVLRPFTLADAAEVQRLAGDPQVSGTTLNIPHPYPDGAAEEWIAGHAPAWAARSSVTFAIVTHAGELRGAIGLALRATHQRAEVGYWIGRPWWGQGLATEAVNAMLAFAFHDLQLNRVQATHLIRNPAKRPARRRGALRDPAPRLVRWAPGMTLTRTMAHG